MCESVVLVQRQQHDVFCAKVQRQQQLFFVRKRSVSNMMLVTQLLPQDVAFLD
ncbi:hypothetical protein [Lysinibacillus sp. G4S2]|uniref:hypothetical protein n=1 Tax=Lysinibacillus sp. G4S2 TaxID=3055859 RepID=UPI00259FF09C|nr:hypothetical protein [Lysinibacillus sp. G4S2]MDM5246352.1 hypothetical protein [Lysinibacillus sp. G4S2]